MTSVQEDETTPSTVNETTSSKENGKTTGEEDATKSVQEDETTPSTVNETTSSKENGKTTGEEGAKKNYEIWINATGAFVGAALGAAATFFSPIIASHHEDEGRKRELRSMACEAHIHTSLPAQMAVSKNKLNQDLIVPRIKISDVEAIKTESFIGLPQPIVSDIAPFRDAELQLAKDEEGEPDFDGLDYVAFVSDGGTDDSKYKNASRDIRNLERTSVKLAQDITSSHMFRGKPNYCDQSVDP